MTVSGLRSPVQEFPRCHIFGFGRRQGWLPNDSYAGDKVFMSLTFLTQLYCLFVLQTLQPRLLFRAKSGKGNSGRLLLSDFVFIILIIFSSVSIKETN